MKVEPRRRRIKKERGGKGQNGAHGGIEIWRGVKSMWHWSSYVRLSQKIEGRYERFDLCEDEDLCIVEEGNRCTTVLLRGNQKTYASGLSREGNTHACGSFGIDPFQILAHNYLQWVSAKARWQSRWLCLQ